MGFQRRGRHTGVADGRGQIGRGRHRAGGKRSRQRTTLTQSRRPAAGKNYRQPLLGQFRQGVGRSGGHTSRPRHHKGAVRLAVDDERVGDLGLVAYRFAEHIGGQHPAGDLGIVQRADDLLERHGVGVAPLGLAVVEHGHRGLVRARAGQRGHPVHVGHEAAEVPVLRVVAVGVEMRRAVGVGERLARERVRHEPVDAAHEEMVGQVFFQPDALGPAVVAKNLAHGVAAFGRFNGRGTLGQGGQAVVVEGAITRAAHIVHPRFILALGQHLAADVVNARHVLALQATEIMPEAGPGAAVLAVILDDMADVAHTVVVAPGGDLFAEIAPYQPGQTVHVRGVDAGSFIAAVLREQPRQRGGPAGAAGFGQGGFQRGAPGQVLAAAQGVAFLVQKTVAKLRFIGEKAGDGLAEIGGIMLPMGFVDRVDQQPHTGRVGHIDVVPVTACVAAGRDHLQRIRPGGLVPVKHRAPNEGQKVCDTAIFGHGLNGQQPVGGRVKAAGRRHFRRKGLHRVGQIILGRGHETFGAQVKGQRAGGHVQRFLIAKDALAAEFVRCGLHRAVGETGGEMAVVQDPDLHPAAAGLVQDHVHVGPPFWAAEVGVRAALDADGLAVGPVDGRHQFPQGGFVLAVLPEKGQDVVVALPGQQPGNGSILGHCLSLPFLQMCRKTFAFSVLWRTLCAAAVSILLRHASSL